MRRWKSYLAAFTFGSLLAVASAFALECPDALKGTAGLNAAQVSWTIETVPLQVAKDKVHANRSLEIIELKTTDGKARSESEIFTDGLADLIVGFDVEGNTQGHMYVVIRGDVDPVTYRPKTLRWDGRLFLRPQQVTEDQFKLSNGLIARYKKIPETFRQNMLNFIREGGKVKAPTCVASAGRLIYDIGGFSNGFEGGRPWFPSSFLKHLAEFGLSDEDGIRLVPDLYTINRDHETFWNNLPNWKRIYKFILPVIANPATWGFKKFDNNG